MEGREERERKEREEWKGEDKEEGRGIWGKERGPVERV